MTRKRPRAARPGRRDPASVDSALAEALRFHHAGRFAEAAPIYRSILAQVPEHPDALHLLGLIEHRDGSLTTARDLISRSLSADPVQPVAWTNFVTILGDRGLPALAAIAAATAAALTPGYGAAHFARGLALGARGDSVAAAAAFTLVLALEPNHAEARANLGAVLLDAGDADAAERVLRAALAAKPDMVDAQCNLANAIRDQNRLDEAVAAYHELLGRWPNAAEILLNLGIALLRQRDRAGAVAALRQATRAKPDLVPAHASLGHVLRELGRHDAAAAACRRALALAPAHGEAHYNLGIVMKDLGRNDDAIRAFAAALACRPSLAVAHANLGVVLREELRLDDALAAFERAGALDAAFAAADSNSLVTMLFMDRFTAAEVLAAHRRFGARHGHAERAAAWRMPDHRERDRDPERCLRIGYLSPQFVAAALGPVMAPVLAAHRRDRVSVHVFAHAPRPDRATERMQTLADRWTFINELDDERVAAAVAAAEIDILVHLMGHWADNRLTVLARRPAPIQALYQCSAPTSGLAEVDYALIDPWFDHDGRLGALMTERPIRLSGGFQVQIYDQEPQIGPPPMLARGHATFGSFNNPAKISDAAMALWARVMAAAPSARLLLRGRGLDRPSPAQALARRFAAAGLAPARIDMRGAVADQAAHLAGHDDIDVVLDTLPFTGGRTTLDALWMGVPVVTLPGDALYGRYSYSHLQRIGAVELIADSADSFVRKAVELATSPERLIDYRQRLRAMVRASPVMDVARHVDELEAAYRSMWRRWCKTPAAGG